MPLDMNYDTSCNNDKQHFCHSSIKSPYLWLKSTLTNRVCRYLELNDPQTAGYSRVRPVYSLM